MACALRDYDKDMSQDSVDLPVADGHRLLPALLLGLREPVSEDEGLVVLVLVLVPVVVLGAGLRECDAIFALLAPAAPSTRVGTLGRVGKSAPGAWLQDADAPTLFSNNAPGPSCSAWPRRAGAVMVASWAVGLGVGAVGSWSHPPPPRPWLWSPAAFTTALPRTTAIHR
jgi:hypothetical protein